MTYFFQNSKIRVFKKQNKSTRQFSDPTGVSNIIWIAPDEDFLTSQLFLHALNYKLSFLAFFDCESMHQQFERNFARDFQTLKILATIDKLETRL